MLVGVTITGADESVLPHELEALSAEFPFVEWGILSSIKKNGCAPRYPSANWLSTLRHTWEETQAAGKTEFKLSLHLCGEQALKPVKTRPSHFGRTQLNGLGNNWLDVIDGRLEERNWIVQARSLKQLQLAALEPKVQVLCDVSGGKGIHPTEWPIIPEGCRIGFAGGINASNIQATCDTLSKAIPQDFWIDLETGVRSSSSTWFDILKAHEILELAQPFIQQVIT